MQRAAAAAVDTPVPKRPVTITHPDREYFPSGFTKADLIRYYSAVSDAMLPHLKNRPVTLIRFPEGVTGERFYEKNAPRHAPDWIQTFKVPRRRREGLINYILVNNVETLAWCANLGAIELHPFLHRAPKLATPTHLAFDLDPGEGANLLTCIEVAGLLREVFGKLGLESFPKVSGSKGLQLYVPLNVPVTYDATTPFARTVAEHLASAHPKLVVSDMKKALRKKRVLIDWSQNSEAKTTVCVYSVRGKREEPFVSCPVTWEELDRAAKQRDLDRLFFTPDDTIARVKKHGDLFAPVLKLKQRLPDEFMALAKRGTRTTRALASTGAVEEESLSLGTGTRPPPGTLSEYARKRDFTRTSEPKPRVSQSRRSPATAGRRRTPLKLKPPTSTGESRRSAASHAAPKPKLTTSTRDGGSAVARFVIQKHAASHLHYDFRLEMDGTLKSWAVPKGLPYELGVKRSAFQVEDHPLDYMQFEGTIPKGQYGGGTVMVWDIGTYELLGGNPERDLKLRLHGKKLKGEWHMFRIRSDDSKPVWLIAKSKQPMKPLTARQEDMSILTRRSMKRIASDNDSQWDSHK